MPNHYHLLLETPQQNLSRAMQWINVSYSVWFNRIHQRVGPLFQGRFKAIIIEPASWGLFLSRYVHLNPVRVRSLGLDKPAQARKRRGVDAAPDPKQIQARLDRLSTYRWSSYRAYTGSETPPQWLNCASVLELISRGSIADQRRAYRRYVEEAVREGLPQNPWRSLAGELILGSEKFLRAIRAKLKGNIKEQPSLRVLRLRPGWPEVLRVIEALKGETWMTFRDRHNDWGRDLALYLARTQCGMTLNELGALAGGLDYRSVSWALARFAQRMRQNKEIRKCFEQALKQIQNPET